MDSPVIRDNSRITQWYIHMERGNKLGKSRDSLYNVGHFLVFVFGDCLVIQVSCYSSYLWVLPGTCLPVIVREIQVLKGNILQ